MKLFSRRQPMATTRLILFRPSVISLIAVLLMLAGEVNADDNYPARNLRIGINVLSLLLIGDINGAIEYTFNNRISLIGTAHYVGSSKFVTAEGEGYRLSVGVRSYGSFQSGDHGFMEFKTGLSYYGSGKESVNSKDNTPLSIEFYGGLSNDFNDYLFYEAKLGLIRFVQSGNVTIGGGFNVGLKF